MARSGINKVDVANARSELLRKGKNPSIDAVRVELGNTGSKSTIHRYLQEIEQESAARLDDEVLLTQPIKELIARLASVLRQEAQAKIDESTTKYDHQLQNLKQKIADLTTTISNYDKQREQDMSQIQNLSDEVNSLKTENDRLQTNCSVSQNEQYKLKALLAEKQVQIDSLEEKHRHNREGIEHYRQSVSEQRKESQRKHEHQIQQFQTEITQLRQTIALKQNDITKLNMDNARLCAELNNAQKSVLGHEILERELKSKIEQLESKNLSLEEQVKKLETTISNEAHLLKKLDMLQQCNNKLKLDLTKLETELTVKSHLVDRMLRYDAKDRTIVNHT